MFSFTITASVTPILVDGSSQDEIFTVNEEVILYCCFMSKEPVQVKWYKDDIPLTTGARYQFGENNQVLSTSSASKLDNGAYRCEGSNKHGRQSWNITVAIHRKEYFCLLIMINICFEITDYKII